MNNNKDKYTNKHKTPKPQTNKGNFFTRLFRKSTKKPPRNSENNVWINIKQQNTQTSTQNSQAGTQNSQAGTQNAQASIQNSQTGTQNTQIQNVDKSIYTITQTEKQIKTLIDKLINMDVYMNFKLNKILNLNVLDILMTTEYNKGDANYGVISRGKGYITLIINDDEFDRSNYENALDFLIRCNVITPEFNNACNDIYKNYCSLAKSNMLQKIEKLKAKSEEDQTNESMERITTDINQLEKKIKLPCDHIIAITEKVIRINMLHNAFIIYKKILFLKSILLKKQHKTLITHSELVELDDICLQFKQPKKNTKTQKHTRKIKISNTASHREIVYSKIKNTNKNKYIMTAYNEKIPVVDINHHKPKPTKLKTINHNNNDSNNNQDYYETKEKNNRHLTVLL